MFALPYFTVFEALGPLVEVTGYAVITVSLIFGWLPPALAVAFFGVAVVLGMAFSFGALLLEERLPALPQLALLRPPCPRGGRGEPGLPAVVRAHPSPRLLVAPAVAAPTVGRDAALGVQSRERPLEVLKSITSGTPSSR
jgi:hypothetical protein